jgi:type II secretory pathway pseudopilin PulG
MKTIIVFIIICILITSLFIWNFGVSRETKEEEPDFFLVLAQLMLIQMQLRL